MFYIFGKPVLVHLCFKYLKMIILTNYVLQTGFCEGLIFEIYGFKGCAKNVHIFKIKIVRLVLIIERCYAYC